ncbi:unnamed protein product, partial [Ectocarpus fasciculatus]
GKTFVVICNQFGGKKTGREIVENIVKPLCIANGVKVEVQYTERHKHAVEIGAHLDIEKYDAIVIVSGDGLIHEFLNGVAREKDSVSALKKFATLPPIGLVPGGTCNGAATSLLSSDPYEAMCTILKGSRNLIDIYRVSNAEGGLVSDCKLNAWDIHGCAWAMLSEADEVLGKIRWVPHMLREPLAAIYLIAKKKVYRISSATQIQRCTVVARSVDWAHKGYHVIDGDFIMIAAMNMPYASYDMKLTPAAFHSDGCIDIVLMRGGCSRLDVLRAFLSMGDGSHAGAPGVELYKATSFTLKRNEGNINISGEIYPSTD